MTPASATLFYEEDYVPMCVGRNAVTEEFFNHDCKLGERVYDLVAPYFEGSSDSAALDIGCRSGGMLMPFSDRGWRVAGCDLSNRYFELGKRAGLCLIQGDAPSLNQCKPADLLIASHVLEHCTSPLSALNEWSNLLKDGGYLFIALPGVLSSYESYGDFALFLQNAHLYHFTLKTLTATLAQTGFQLVKGDETIYALFTKTGGSPQPSFDEREAKRILDYLNRHEKRMIVKQWVHKIGRFMPKHICDQAVTATKRVRGNLKI
jgi:SAM-dependent methyltransferase